MADEAAGEASLLDSLTAPIETRRYVVRGVEERDLANLFEVHRDDDVTAFLPYDTWRSMDDARSWLERVRSFEAEGRSRQLVVVDRQDQRAIGAIVLFNVDVGAGRAEIGYVLGKQDWGKGVMMEVLPPLIERAFGDLRLRRLEAFADSDNSASDRLLRRLDFVHEGTMRQREVIKGRVRDASVYGLLRDEWKGFGSEM